MNELVIDVSSEGLNPLKDRIVGITTKSASAERIFADRDELVILEKFWNYTTDFNRIIGFNISEFDFPMLFIRSIKHKVKIPKLKIVDLRRVIFGDKYYAKGTLTDFQELLGIKFHDSLYKKMHMSLLWEDDFPKVREFMMRDCKITWELFLHLNGAGLV